MTAMGGATLQHVKYLSPTSDPCRLLDELKSIRYVTEFAECLLTCICLCCKVFCKLLSKLLSENSI